MNKSDRKVYIDLIKIIAIFMVVYNHTDNRGFLLFTEKLNSPLFFFYIFLSVLVKTAVPLFFMCSGALLLEKKESISTLINKRFLKYLIILIIVSFIQYIYHHNSQNDFSILSFVSTIYAYQVLASYWFLYAYLAFILMLPFIRRLATSMTDREYQWMILLYGFVSILTICEYIVFKGEFFHNQNFYLFITTIYVFYPLMGYYLEHKTADKYFNIKNLLILVAVSVLCIVITCCAMIYIFNKTGKWNRDFISALSFIPVITIFYGIKMLFIKHQPNKKLANIISTLGGTVLGIYLFEKNIQDLTTNIFDSLNLYISTFPACIIWVLITCVLGSLITYILKLIPIFKKIL